MSQRRLSCEAWVFPEPAAEPTAMRDLLDRVPLVRQALLVDGVPRAFIGRYTADSAVTIVERGDGAPLLRFGSGASSQAIGVDISTGHVVRVSAARGSRLLFVNTSIGQFTQTVKALIERFPYYDADATGEETDAVAAELLEIIEGIDPEAGVPDRFWSTLADDAAIGDLTTENILGPED